MRILHIDTEMTWRGGENQLRLLLEGLGRSDAESHVAAQPGSQAAVRLGRLAPLVPVRMRGGFDPRAAWRLKAYCRAHRIQLIDAHTSNAHGIALLLKALAPELKLVVHRRVDYPPSPGFASRWKYMTPKVDAFVAISEAIRRVLVEYGVPSGKIRVARSAVDGGVYGGIDRAQAKAALAQAYGIDPRLPFYGNASALTDQKGHDVLLRAARRLKDRGLPCHSFVAGDGELRDALEKQRIELGLEHDVTFVGFLDDVPRFLSGLDVLAVPSNFEGLGTIILDGIHAGLCVAATEVGGIPEMIRHGVTGLLSPVGDDAALADNLERALGDADLRAALAAQAQAHVRVDFSVGAMVGGNLEVYREVLGR